jgi:hypothetical protein
MISNLKLPTSNQHQGHNHSSKQQGYSVNREAVVVVAQDPAWHSKT